MIFGLRLITDSEYKLLIEQRDSALTLFTAERQRSDRLIDQVISMSGNEPVGDEYQQQKKQAESAFAAQQRELSEIYEDTAAQVLGGTVAKGEESEDAKETPAEDIVAEISAAVNEIARAGKSPKVEK